MYFPWNILIKTVSVLKWFFEMFYDILIKSAGDAKSALMGGPASTVSLSVTNLKYSFRHLVKLKRSCLLNGVWRNSLVQRRNTHTEQFFHHLKTSCKSLKSHQFRHLLHQLFSNNFLLLCITPFYGRYKVLYCSCLRLESLSFFVLDILLWAIKWQTDTR